MGLRTAPGIGILSPYFFWAMWPRQVEEKYVNAWGCMQPHTCGILSPIPVLGNVALDSRRKSCHCVAGEMQPHAVFLSCLGHVSP